MTQPHTQAPRVSEFDNPDVRYGPATLVSSETLRAIARRLDESAALLGALGRDADEYVATLAGDADMLRACAGTPLCVGAERDDLGRRVREIWVDYCVETGDTNPAHLAGWDALDEHDREVDRRIGEILYLMGVRGWYRPDKPLLLDPPATATTTTTD